MNQYKKSLLILLFIPMIWGLTFPLIKMATPYINSPAFVAVRFALAIVALLPFVLSRLFVISMRRMLQALLLGVLNAACLICQMIGLETLDVPSSAFITSTAVIIVPFLLPLFHLGKIRLLNIFCSALCLLGLYILTRATLHQNITGVLWTLLCGLFYALFVVYLQKIQPQQHEVLLLAFYQMLGSVILASLFLHSSTMHITFNFISIMALGFCSIIATTFILILQTRYQQNVPAAEVMLLYALESIFASLFSFLLLHQPITLNIILGGLLIISSIWVNGKYNRAPLK